MITLCPYEREERYCERDVDYQVSQNSLRETEELYEQLLEEHRELKARMTKAEQILTNFGIDLSELDD